MKITFTKKGLKEFEYWKNNNKSISTKIVALLEDIVTNDPYNGIGKPEPLKHSLKGYWSRRINHEHRLVYKIIGNKNVRQECIVIQCRYHY